MDTSGNLDIDIAIEVLGLIGMLDGLANSADAATVILALIKKDPILASICILASAPVIGLIAPKLKTMVKGLSEKEAIQLLSREIKKLGSKADPIIDSARETTKLLVKRIAENAEYLADITGTPSKELIEVAEETERIVENIFRNIEDISKPTLKLTSKQLDAVKSQLNESIRKTLVSLRSGPLKSSVTKSANLINKLVKDGRRELWEDILTSDKDRASYAAMLLNKSQKHFVGRKINVGERTIEFKSASDFKESLSSVWKAIDSPMSWNEFLTSKVREISNFGAFDRPRSNIDEMLSFNSTDVEILTRSIIAQLNGLKLKVATDPKALDITLNTGGGISDAAGAMSHDGEFFFLHLNNLNIDGDIISNDSMIDLKDTIEHELLHFIDAQMAVAMFGSLKPWDLSMVTTNYLTDLRAMHSGVLKMGSRTLPASVFNELPESGLKIYDMSISEYNDFVDLARSSSKISDLREEMYLLYKDIDVEIPSFHIDYMTYKFQKKGKLDAPVKKERDPLWSPEDDLLPERQNDAVQHMMKNEKSALMYDATPVELFPGIQSTAEYAKKKGYNLSETKEEIIRFLKETEHSDVVRGGTHSNDADVYKYFFDIAKSNDKEAIQTAVDYFNSFL